VFTLQTVSKCLKRWASVCVSMYAPCKLSIRPPPDGKSMNRTSRSMYPPFKLSYFAVLSDPTSKLGRCHIVDTPRHASCRSDTTKANKAPFLPYGGKVQVFTSSDDLRYGLWHTYINLYIYKSRCCRIQMHRNNLLFRQKHFFVAWRLRSIIIIFGNSFTIYKKYIFL